jgi:glycosyltransferase involved in cell wall biosynthesis
LSRLRILHVWNDFPLPPHHGGRIDVWGRVQALRELGHEVDAIATVKRMPEPQHHLAAATQVRRLTVIERTPNLWGMLGREPLQMRTRRRLAQLRFSQSYDVVLLEQEYVAPVLDAAGLECGRLILRVHNQECEFFADQARAERCWWKRLYYREEARRFKHASPQIFRQADELWFISWDHWRRWRNQNPAAPPRSAWLPASLPAPIRFAPRSGERVLITGNLFQPANLEGLEWFLDQVHPWLLRRPAYELWVAGSTRGGKPPAIVRRLEAAGRVHLFLNQADLDPLYREAAVFVNPMRRGVSVKLKTLDAICRGLPVVSGAAGLDGAGLEPGKHVILAEGGVATAEAIARLLDAPSERHALVQAAQAFLARTYDQKANLERLLAPAPGPASQEPVASICEEPCD